MPTRKSNTSEKVQACRYAIMRKLPEGFKLGVATASHQIEGALDAGDRTPSIWDNFSRIPGKIADNSTADEACKSYHYYQRDIKMIKFLGADFYRFSISWTRILPTGFADKISKDGVDYYNKLIDELLAHGIEPMVTIYHWDLPQSLQDLGGWANPQITDWFKDYAKVLFEVYGDRVKTWITINEPKQVAVYGYGEPMMAPGLNAHGIGEYLCAKHMVMANAKAWHVYDKEFRPKQKGTCSITIATDFREGETDCPEDVEAGLDAMEFEVGLYSHPIFSSKGGFPERVVRLVAERSKEQGFPRSRLPDFTPEEIEFVKGTSDYYGFNHYSTQFYTRKRFVPGMYAVPSYDDDIGAAYSYLDYEPAPAIHTTVIPQGIRKALNWIKDSYNNPPVMITENGYSTYGGMDDEDRINYHNKYLNEVLNAIDYDGCNVKGYTVWSLMDNFEWVLGLKIKFGIFEVDYDDDKRARKPRASAFWFKQLCSTRTFDPEFRPERKELTF